MFGNNHSIRRIATGIALAAVTAAVVAPAGFAAAGPQVGPPDPWELPYLHASQGQGGFVTDTTNSAQVARNAGTGILPAGFATDTLNSARVAHRPAPGPRRPRRAHRQGSPPRQRLTALLRASAGAGCDPPPQRLDPSRVSPPFGGDGFHPLDHGTGTASARSRSRTRASRGPSRSIS